MRNFVATWAMIASGDGTGWAQSGYVRWYNHCTVTFTQDAVINAVKSTTYGTTCQQDEGQLNTFTEKYDGGCECIYEMENSRILHYTGFDPKGYWTSPWDPEFFGEAAYLESDIPGNSVDPSTFSALKYQGADGSFYSYECQVLTAKDQGTAMRSDGQQWYIKTSTCPGFNIYTDTAGG
jgi:hypothetical protein